MQRFTQRGLALIVILSVVLAGLIVLSLNPSGRRAVRGWLFSDSREILAKTTGYLSKEGPFVSIFKIREKDSLFLEVYAIKTNDKNETHTELIQRIDLPEARDGYFNFMGNATNLALSDTDNDGTMELLAPTFDQQMTARLNVFKFNQTTQTFDRASAPNADHE